MKLIIEQTEQEMSQSAMHILLGAMLQDKRVNISLTGGRSPKTMYQMMIPLIKDKEAYKDIQYYLFDENPYTNGQVGPNWQDLQDLFFKEANIPDERIHIMNDDDYLDFDNKIKEVGGIDVMVIGLGQDGHFCGNCPRCTPFDSYTYRLAFPEKQAVNPTYKDRPFQPATLTMGPKSLMRVKHLVMIVNGLEKAEVLKRFLDEPINQDIPATILKLHPNFTVIVDKDAASLLNKEDYKNI